MFAIKETGTQQRPQCGRIYFRKVCGASMELLNTHSISLRIEPLSMFSDDIKARVSNPRCAKRQQIPRRCLTIVCCHVCTGTNHIALGRNSLKSQIEYEVKTLAVATS